MKPFVRHLLLLLLAVCGLPAMAADTTKPTVTFTAPTANQRWSNSLFTVTGKAADNVAVTNVYVSLDGTNFTAAATANSFTNWHGDVNLTPGTNTVYAYSIDSSGNKSLTNKVSMFYVLATPVTVAINGAGTVAPNYNGQSLEIGRSYTMTATAKTGSVFTNWTGSITTNKAALSFLMAPGLTFTANFTDITKPTVTITAPTAAQRWSNSLFNVVGKATDNVLVTNVYVSLDLTNWSGAISANNFTNWTCAVNLTPGTNTVYAYSVDSTGLVSVTNKVSMVYVLTTSLTVAINGAGTVAPNYNGQQLEIGKSYTMTATAKTGSVFTNWTGSISTNKAALTFLMASNLTFTANFVDITKPTVTITAPTALQRWSNSLFNVVGKATDNVLVTNVYVSLDLTNWSGAISANNFTNWTCAVNLTPGTNTVYAYSVDSTGLLSTTNKVSMVYVLTAPLAVAINGAGTVTPNYNGQLLEIGKSYLMTATAKTGSVFTNWTGSITTNKAALTFIMASNLTFTANFADVTIPTLTITTPTANQRWSNSVFNVTGKAADNVGVANVFCSLDGTNWVTPSTANSFTNWNISAPLVPGTNVLWAYAVDGAGNNSLTNKVNLIYVLSDTLTVAVVGPGTVSPNYNGQLLEIGKSYTMTATPTTGNYFGGWTGSITTNKAALTFIMQSNLTFTATFAANPFLTLSGSYVGLFFPTNGTDVVDATNSGYFSFTLATAGTFTGKALMMGATLNFSGTMDINGHATVTATGTGVPSVSLDLQMDLGSGQVSGTVTGSPWVTPLTGYPAATSINKGVGNYTFGIEGPNDSSASPAGHSPVIVTASSAGVVTATGTTSDGQTISQSTSVTDGYWPFYASLYGGKGILIGWFNVQADDTGKRKSPLFWSKAPAPGDAFYPAGFAEQRQGYLYSYKVPATGENMTGWKYGEITFSYGNFDAVGTNTAGDLTSYFYISNNVVHLYGGAINGLTITNTGTSGLIVGAFTHPKSGLATPFKAVILQTLEDTTNYNIFGAGWFLGSSQGGRVFIQQSTNRPVEDPVPASLNNYTATVMQDGDNKFFNVSFGASTFSTDFGPDLSSSTNGGDNGGVGSYTFTKQSATTGKLVLTFTSPPNHAGHSTTVNLTFTNATTAGFVSVDSETNTGSFTISEALNTFPSSIAGNNLNATTGSGDSVSVSFDTSTTFTQNQGGDINTGTYTLTKSSPNGGMLKMTYTNGSQKGAVNYLGVTLYTPWYGGYISSFFKTSTSSPNVDTGPFTFPF